MSGVALPDAVLGEVGDFLGAAMRAFHHTVRPAKLHHDRLAVLEIAEVYDCLLKGLEVFHATSMHHFARYVKYIITLISHALLNKPCNTPPAICGRQWGL